MGIFPARGWGLGTRLVWLVWLQIGQRQEVGVARFAITPEGNQLAVLAKQVHLCLLAVSQSAASAELQ